MRSIKLAMRWSVTVIFAAIPVLAVSAEDKRDAVSVPEALPRAMGERAESGEWPRNGRDLANSRYSPLDQLDTQTIRRLTVRWIQQIAAGGSTDFGPRHQTVPIVADGRMFVTNMRANVFAIDPATGERLWQFTLPEIRLSRISRIVNRGAVYGDGKVYTAAGGRMFALDAATGVPVATFGGDQGKPVIGDAIRDRYPGRTTASVGYDSTAAPQYFDGMVILTANHGENHCPGGWVIAVDGNTGDIVWRFNAVPQKHQDEGWTAAGPTWAGGVRNGGGVWNTPAIDPELAMIYFAVGNPSPDLDGSARRGINLFTDSIVALDVYTGQLKWYFQQIHHDVWDYDSAAPVILFDTQVNGRTVKACAQASKNGYLFILNRETGEPINSIVETPVSTSTDVPGEEIWPTQPIPYTAAGQPMASFVPTYPEDVPAPVADLVAPFFTPLRAGRFTILAPSLAGGALNSQPGFSRRTGLLYISGIDRLNSVRVIPVGATIRTGQGSFNGVVNGVARAERGTLTAYDPASGELAWQAQLSGQAQGGVLVTAGNLVFVGTGAGFLHGFNATTGEELFRFNTGNRIHAPPITYTVNGEQRVTVAAGDTILTFALLQL